jgi:hypothetical protein
MTNKELENVKKYVLKHSQSLEPPKHSKNLEFLEICNPNVTHNPLPHKSINSCNICNSKFSDYSHVIF